MQKSGLSIKYKLLLLLVILPASVLALYLLLATQIFKSDKIAYVYDSSAAVSKTLAVQVGAEMERFENTVATVWRGYGPATETFTPLSEKLFESNESIF